MDWSDILTALVALYGAGLSTYIAVNQWRARRPNIKVGLSIGVFDSCAGSPTNTMVFLVAANPGNKAVTLGWMGVLVPNRGKVTFTDPHSNLRFPHELLPEESCQVWVEASEFATRLKSDGFSGKVKLIGFYQDVVGRTYKSKPFEFDVDVSYA